MKITTFLFILSIWASAVCGQDVMTVERFKELVAAPGDTKQLRPELAVAPYWARSRFTNTMRYANGRVLEEECDVTKKTVEGEYIVVSFTSKAYKQPMHTIIGYDRQAGTTRQWSLYGERLIGSIGVCDVKKKVSASTVTDGDFLELGVTSFSDKEISFRVEVFKNGIRFLVREGREFPVSESGKAEQAGADQPVAKPADKAPAKDQPLPPTPKDAPR